MFKTLFTALMLAFVTVPAVADDGSHWYVMKDGNKYGYQPAMSDMERAAGVGSPKLVMVRYFGERDGVHQVEIEEGQMHVVLECGEPCEYIKAMQFYGNEHERTDYMRATRGTIGWMAMQDAAYDNLDVTTFEKPTANGKVKMNIWVSEKDGPIYTPAKDQK